MSLHCFFLVTNGKVPVHEEDAVYFQHGIIESFTVLKLENMLELNGKIDTDVRRKFDKVFGYLLMGGIRDFKSCTKIANYIKDNVGWS